MYCAYYYETVNTYFSYNRKADDKKIYLVNCPSCDSHINCQISGFSHVKWIVFRVQYLFSNRDIQSVNNQFYFTRKQKGQSWDT